MEQVAILQAVVTADIVDFETKMNKVRTSAQQTSGFLSGLGDFGQTLTMGLTLPLVGAGLAIAKVGSDFDAEMRNINSLLQLSEEQFKTFGEEVTRVGSASTYGANKTADALYTIVSAGIGIKDTAKAMDLLGVSMKVAESGRDDLERTTMAMIAMHETFGDIMSDEQIGDVVANMVQMGAGPLSSYTQNMAKVAPAADMLGVSFYELGSNISQLSLIYGNGSKPMTAMGMLMSNLIKPNLTLQEGLHNLGVNGFKDLMVKAGGFNEALFMLQGTMSEFDFNKSFSKTGFEAVAILTNDINGTREAYTKFMATVDGAAERAWEEQMKSFDAAFTRAKAAVEGVAVALSSTLLPILTPIFDKVAELGNAFINADPAMQRMVVIFGLLAAAVGPVLMAIGSLASLFSPFGILVGGAAAAAGMAAGNFNGMGDKMNDLITIAKDALKPLADVVDALITLASYKFDPLGGEDQTPTDWGQVMGQTTIPDPARFIKVEKPTSVWNLYKERGYDELYSWEEFKAEMMEGGWEGGNIAIKPGDIISFGDPGDIEMIALKGANTAFDIVKGSFTSVFTKGTQGGARAGWFGSPEGMWNESVMDHIHNARAAEGLLKNALIQLWDNVAAVIPGLLQGVSVAIGGAAGYLGNAFVDLFNGIWDWLNSGGPAAGASSVLSFINANIIAPFTTAFGIAWPDIEADLNGLWTKLSGWFDEKVGMGLDFLAGLFTGTSASGGETGVYNAVKALLEGDIYRAIDAIIPGAGTHLQSLIGGDWGAKIGGAFPEIEKGLGNLASKFGEWFMNDAVPTVARSIGYFVGRIGGILTGALKNLFSGSLGSVDGGSMMADLGESVGVPFASGLQEGLGSTGEVDMSDSMKGLADQFVTSMAGALGVAAMVQGAWGLATGGIWAGLKAAMTLPMWFAGSMLSVGGQIAGALASAVAAKLGIAATWTGFGGAIIKGIAALPALAMTGVSWLATAATSIAGSIITTLGISTTWTGIAGAISLGLQAVKVIGLTIVDFAGTVAGAIASPILAQMGMTTTWATMTSSIGAGISLLSNLGSIAITNAGAWAAAIVAPIIAQVRLVSAWTGLTGAVTAGIGAVAAPAMLALSGAASWAAAIATPLVAAVGSAAAWMGITAGLWAAAAPILAIGVAVGAVIAAISNYNNTIKEGEATAQIAVKAAVTVGLTEQELQDQVFASIQSSPLGDIGARIFYTNFAAQAKGDVVFTADTVTLTEPLPDVQPLVTPLKVSSAMELALDIEAAGFDTGLDPFALIKADLDSITVTDFFAPNTPAEVKRLGDETIAAITSTTAVFGEKVATMVADGTLDPETVNQNFLIPLTAYWQAAFGATGSLATATTGFTTSFVTGMGSVDTAFVTTLTGATTNLTLLTDTLTMKRDEITGILTALGDSASTSLVKFGTSFQSIMQKVGLYVSTLTGQIGGLVNGINTLANVGGGPSTGIDGSHESGLGYVPHDGYVAELHKGEMVLTAEQASNYRMPQQAITTTKNSTSNNSNVVVNITGVQDVNSLIRELKRMGIPLG